jgi:DNA-binding transcriptional ArsR family regulator
VLCKLTEDEIDKIFFALADPTRRALLDRLNQGEATVTELCIPFPMSMVAILKHLKILKEAKLISEEKAGRVKSCRIEPERLKMATQVLEKYLNFWNHQLDNLEKFLNDPE